MSLVKTLWFNAWTKYACLVDRRNERVTGNVATPRPGQPFVHVIEVSGWASGRQGEPVSVRITTGGRVVAETTANRESASAHTSHDPAVAGAQNGFHVLVRASNLPQRRVVWLSVAARTLADLDAEYEPIMSLPVIRVKGPLRQLPRYAYGAVWDRVSPSFDAARIAVAGYADTAEWQRSGQSTADNLVSKSRITLDDVVLEIGCGAGRVGVHLVDRCRHWIGSDVSANMLRYAAEALAHRSNVSFVRLNNYDLSGVADESVDVVYCTAVFMHIEEWDRFRYVQEAYRVLRPGGRVYYDSFDLLSEQGWKLFEQLTRVDPAMRRPNISKASTPQELQVFAEKAGFGDIVVETGLLWVAVMARKPTARSAGTRDSSHRPLVASQ